jgi:hypothetical protein
MLSIMRKCRGSVTGTRVSQNRLFGESSINTIINDQCSVANIGNIGHLLCEFSYLYGTINEAKGAVAW